MKRILSFFTVLCLVAMCLPVNITVLADNGFSITDYTLTETADNTVTVESITVQAASTEDVTLYTAVYNSSGVLKKVVSMKIENVGENVLKPNLTYERGEKAKAFLWKGMEPLTNVCELKIKAPVTPAIEIYVATNGNDETGDGTIGNPFASFEKAQNVVRTKNKNMGGDIIVYFRGGTYCLDKTITLGTEDSGSNGYNVQYKAYPGEKPVLSGGQKVTGWAQDAQYTNLYSTSLTRDEKLRQLFVNDKRAYMPSKAVQGQGGYGEHTITEGEGSYAWETLTKSDGVKFNTSDMPADIKNPSDIEVQTRTTWQTQTVAIRDVQSIDGYTVALFEQPYGTMAQNLSWNTAYSPSKRNYVYNVFEFLDEPGEFYFDRTAQKLYYWPREGEDMANADVYAPEIETLLRIKGDNLQSHASHIVIDGLTFENSDWNLAEVAGSHGKTSTQASLTLTSTAGNWHYSSYRSVDTTPAAVEAESADNIAFINNVVRHTANDGLNIINDVTDSVFEGNSIYDTAASGMSIGHPQHHFIGDKGSAELTGYKDPSNQHSNLEKYDVDTEGVCTRLEIKNNNLQDLGKFYYGCPGMSIYYGTELKVLNNYITGTPYSGIALGWGWGYMRGASLSDTGGSTSEVGETPNLQNNEIAYNRIMNVLTVLSDGGAIYTLGPMRGTTIHDNYISGVGSNGYHNRGIHLDEGTRYAKLYHNVINVELSQAAIDAGSWGRNSNVYHQKGHNTIYDNYTTTESYTTTGGYEVGTTIENKHPNISAFWSEQTPIDIIRASGLSDEYLTNSLENPANLVLAANYSLYPETGITEIDVPQTIDGEIWLAPEGTTEFTESDTVKKATDGKLAIPTEKGEYYVYVVKGGAVKGISDKHITTSKVEVVTEVDPRDDVIGPFWADDTKENHVDKVQGTGGNVEDTGFGTAVAVDEDSAVFGITKLAQSLNYKRINAIDNGNGSKWDGYVSKTVTMERGGDYDIYIMCFATQERGFNVFVDNELAAVTDNVNTGLSRVYSSTNGLHILKETIWLNEGDNVIKIQGNGSAPNFMAFALTEAVPALPTDGLQLWLRADKGVVTDDNDYVTKWTDVSGNKRDAVSENTNAAPLYTIEEITAEPTLLFDGTDDCLKFPFENAIANKTGMTVIAVSKTDAVKPSDNAEGVKNPLLYFGGTDELALAPFSDRIVVRIPTSGEGSIERTAADGMFSTVAIVKDGEKIEFYNESSESIGSVENVNNVIENISDLFGYIGGGDASFFNGEIAEIIIYDKAVDLGVVQSINTYLNEKYYPTEPKDIELTGKLDIMNGTQNEGVTTPGAASKNRYIKNVFGQSGWQTGNKYMFGVDDDYRAAFDSDISSYYDAPVGGYCGVEFNKPQVVTKIGYKARKSTDRLNGAVLQGSKDGESYTDIMTITDASTSEMKYAATNCTEAYKYIRLKIDGNVLNIHELELYTIINPQ